MKKQKYIYGILKIVFFRTTGPNFAVEFEVIGDSSFTNKIH